MERENTDRSRYKESEISGVVIGRRALLGALRLVGIATLVDIGYQQFHPATTINARLISACSGKNPINSSPSVDLGGVVSGLFNEVGQTFYDQYRTPVSTSTPTPTPTPNNNCS